MGGLYGVSSHSHGQDPPSKTTPGQSTQSKSPSQNPSGQFTPSQNLDSIFKLETYFNVTTVFFGVDSDKNKQIFLRSIFSRF